MDESAGEISCARRRAARQPDQKSWSTAAAWPPFRRRSPWKRPRASGSLQQAASPSKAKSTPTAGPALDAAPLDYFEAILKDSPHGTSNATTRFQAAHFWWTDPTPRQLADYDTELAAAARGRTTFRP